MKLQQWEEAAHSFQRLVCVDGTIAEGWNNLAASYIQLDKYEEAFTAMYHGVKFDRTNWKMWENLLILSIQTGKIPQSMECIRSLLRLNQTRLLDEKIFKVLNGYSKATERWGEVERVYNEVVNKISVSGRVWKTYADFIEMHDGVNETFNQDRIVNLRLKACRAAMAVPNWDSEPKNCEELVILVTELIAAYQKINDETVKIEGRLFVQNAKEKLEEKLEREIEFPSL